MQDTRSRFVRWTSLLAISAVVAVACSNPAASSTAPTDAPPAATDAPASDAPASDATAFKIGYISLGDSVPFVKLVSDGIRDEAEKAGQTLLFCDSEIDEAKALACAQNLKVQGAEGVINFQVFQAASPEICAAYGDLPTIAIDIIQPPCQVAFMGADNHEAGRLAGAEIGKFAKAEWDCDFTAYVSLESVAAGAANTDRMGGMRDGFKESCPIPADKERIIDGADRTDPGLEKVTNLLGALPGDRIIVVAINEDGILGALGAANTLGRGGDLYYAGQGADPSAWKEIACNPNYIATVAYFPERYGTLLVPNMVKLLQGETIPENIFTEHTVINRDNIREVYPETPAC